MATHTQLPIYKAAYDLLDVSIGEKITNECIEITIWHAVYPEYRIYVFGAVSSFSTRVAWLLTKQGVSSS